MGAAFTWALGARGGRPARCGVECEVDRVGEGQFRTRGAGLVPWPVAVVLAGGREEPMLESGDHVGVADGSVGGGSAEEVRGAVRLAVACSDRRQPGQALGGQPRDHELAADPKLLLERALSRVELAREGSRQAGDEPRVGGAAGVDQGLLSRRVASPLGKAVGGLEVAE